MTTEIRKTRVTEEEVHQALRRFRKSGGLVRELPPQPAPSRALVGERLGAFENPPRGVAAFELLP